MQHLEEQYSFFQIDYKIFHPNLIRNHDHIKFDQKSHRDFTIDPPIVVTKKKNQKTSKWKSESKSNYIYGKKL